MIFRDLVMRYEFEPVWQRLVKLYPDQKKSKDGYEQVFNRLKKLRKQPSDLMLTIEKVEDTIDKTTYVHVSGYDLKENISYAIEFTPWQEWLSMPISKDSFIAFSEVDILAHCLWEMTWDGFDQRQIQGKFRGLMNTVKKIHDDTSTKKD